MLEAHGLAGDAFRHAMALDANATIAPDEIYDASIPDFLEAQRALAAGKVCDAATQLKQMAVAALEVGDRDLGRQVLQEAVALRPDLAVTDATRDELLDPRGDGPKAPPFPRMCVGDRVVDRPTAAGGASLVVDVNASDAVITVAGIPAGRSGDRLLLTPGVNEIVVSHPDFGERHIWIKAHDGEAVKARVELVPRAAHH
jgi:hypothetical protein